MADLMNYYEFYGVNAYTKADDCFLIQFPLEVWNGVSFFDARPIPNWDRRYIAAYPGTEFLHLDCLQATVPLVSRRLGKFLERFLKAHGDDKIQLLPLRLQAFNGSGEVRGYSILRALTRVDCIDRKRTEVENGNWRKDRSGWYSVRYGVTLLRKPMQGHHLFRVDGWPFDLVISEVLREALVAEGFTVGKFGNPDFSD